METEKVMEKIERWKLLADLFVKKNIPAFIKEINGDIHFCYVILNGEDSLLIDNFAPEQRKGKRERVYWLTIKDFDKYEKGEPRKLNKRLNDKDTCQLYRGNFIKQESGRN